MIGDASVGRIVCLLILLVSSCGGYDGGTADGTQVSTSDRPSATAETTMASTVPSPTDSTTASTTGTTVIERFVDSGDGCWPQVGRGDDYDDELDALSDRLAHRAEPQIDAFTGDAMIPDQNLIYAQLVSGVESEDIVYPPMIPIAVNHSGVDRNLILVLRDDVADIQLGWVDVGPLNPGVMRIEVAAPLDGHEMSVYVVDDNVAFAQPCDGDVRPAALFAVPYDDVAGSKRALLLIGESTHTSWSGS